LKEVHVQYGLGGIKEALARPFNKQIRKLDLDMSKSLNIGLVGSGFMGQAHADSGRFAG
jgi:hypothetical protein